MKVKSMLTETFVAWPADRISRGHISLGTSQPKGPHDHAKAATYAQIKNKMKSASNLDNTPVPSIPNFHPIMPPTAICQTKIHKDKLGLKCNEFQVNAADAC